MLKKKKKSSAGSQGLGRIKHEVFTKANTIIPSHLFLNKPNNTR